jgi:hypothetical protein
MPDFFPLVELLDHTSREYSLLRRQRCHLLPCFLSHPMPRGKRLVHKHLHMPEYSLMQGGTNYPLPEWNKEQQSLLVPFTPCLTRLTFVLRRCRLVSLAVLSQLYFKSSHNPSTSARKRSLALMV